MEGSNGSASNPHSGNSQSAIMDKYSKHADPERENPLAKLQEDLTENLLLSSSSHSSPLQPPDRPAQQGRIRIIPIELRNFLLHAGSLRYARRTIRRLGHYLAYFTLIGMLIFVPLVLYRALRERNIDLAAFNSAWVMTCGTIILSVRLVYLHLTHWYMPEVQKYVVRIVWMVPLYAVQSYLSLRFHEARIYIDSVRDFYEAFVIASFVYYLMELLGGQDAIVEILRNKADDPRLGQHAFPLSLILEPWEPGLEFMLQCKHGVLQYVVFKTMSTVLTIVFQSLGVYGEGTFEWYVAYPYLCFFQNMSVMYALYCLVMLFYAVENELRHPINWRPLGKFLCVKAVVFFCWWQGVVIYFLRAHEVIKEAGNWSSEEVANGLASYCVVIEMVFFAIAHSYTFTYKEYLPENLPPQTTTTATTTETSGVATVAVSLNGAPSTQTSQDETAATTGRVNTYRPPATLPQPMNFKAALWSSTVPKETIQDIQRLRAGLDTSFFSSFNNNNSSDSISSNAVTPISDTGSDDDANDDDSEEGKGRGPPEHSIV